MGTKGVWSSLNFLGKIINGPQADEVKKTWQYFCTDLTLKTLGLFNISATFLVQKADYELIRIHFYVPHPGTNPKHQQLKNRWKNSDNPVYM
jgi:hypothetical protein